MNKLLWQSSFALATVAFLAACGDETTNVTETTGPTSVAKFKDLDECTTENDGALVYVKDSAAAYLCSDSVWNVLSITAANGSNGKNETGPTVKMAKTAVMVRTERLARQRQRRIILALNSLAAAR